MRDDPLIIGALGGSGTRMVTRLVTVAGVFMGGWVNEAEDSEPIQHFYKAWLRQYLAQGGNLGSFEFDAAEKDFRRALDAHRTGIHSPDAAWGAKVPRSILMLGFWQQLFPRFRFIHVVRNGLDMVYSSDHRQRDMVGDLMLSERERADDEVSQAMTYWCRVNMAAADFGEQHMTGRYLRVRYEDLCTRPIATVRELVEFASARPRDDVINAVVGMISPSATRWREKPVAETDRLASIGSVALERFGYRTVGELLED